MRTLLVFAIILGLIFASTFIYVAPIVSGTETTYYFNSYSGGEAWEVIPERMVDNNLSLFAKTAIEGRVELCDGNTYSSGGSGTITKVELRAYCKRDNTADIYLRPVFTGGDGNNHELDIGTSGAWSTWQDITTDTNAPSPWTWGAVNSLDCDVDAFVIAIFSAAYCAKVEIQVTYTVNTAPTQSNELPTNQSIITDDLPLLNVTCTDAEGNSMNATWLSNSSGSWVQFASNETSFSNGSIQQTNSNFTADYNTTYWWSVNLTDGNGGWDNETYHFSMNGYFPYCAIYFNGTDNIVSANADDGTLVFDIPFDIAPDKSANTLVEIWCGSDSSAQFNSSGSYNTSASFEIDTMYCHLWQVYDTSPVAGTEYTIGYNTTYPTPMTNLESYTFNINDKLTYVTSNVDPTNDTFNLTAFMWDVDESLALFTNTSDIYQNFTVHFTGSQTWIITNKSISSFIILNVPSDIWDGTDNSTDTDGDGLSDHMELNTTYGYYTDPFRSDTDGDGVTDYGEHISGSDPNNYTDTLPYSPVPTLTGECPVNNSTNIELTPSLHVICTDEDSDTMTATWRSNSTGSWVDFATNNTISTGTNITQTNSNFSLPSMTYYWSVNLTDSTNWINETYSFTTMPFNTTIRTNGIDYFVWLGTNTTAYWVAYNITGLNSGVEYIAVWR